MDKKLELALAIVKEEFKNKLDKGGHKYLGHLVRVSLNCKTNKQKVVALLHDLLEDTPYPLERLKEQFSEEICSAVVLLTKKKNQDYDEYLKAIDENKLARYVKLRDLEDNLDILRLERIEISDLLRIAKYYNAHRFLNGN